MRNRQRNGRGDRRRKDYIGAEIAKKFRREGFNRIRRTARRRKLRAAGQGIETAAERSSAAGARRAEGRRGRGFPQRDRPDKHAPLKCASFKSAPTSTSYWRPRTRIRKVLENGLLAALLAGAKFGAIDGAGGKGNISLPRHRQSARGSGYAGLRQREFGLRAVAQSMERRTRTEGHSRRASDHRFRVDTRGCAERREKALGPKKRLIIPDLLMPRRRLAASYWQAVSQPAQRLDVELESARSGKVVVDLMVRGRFLARLEP